MIRRPMEPHRSNGAPLRCTYVVHAANSVRCMRDSVQENDRCDRHQQCPHRNGADGPRCTFPVLPIGTEARHPDHAWHRVTGDGTHCVLHTRHSGACMPELCHCAVAVQWDQHTFRCTLCKRDVWTFPDSAALDGQIAHAHTCTGRTVRKGV